MLIIICGPATVGKDSVWIPAIEHFNFKKYVPYTSRSMRCNESHGKDYHFITTDEFQKRVLNNEFLEWDFFHGNYYGTSYDILTLMEQDNVVMHALSRMAYRIRKKIEHTFIISLTSKNCQVIKERLLDRDYNSNDMVIRCSHFVEENTHSVFADLVVENSENKDISQVIDIIDNKFNLTSLLQRSAKSRAR